MRKVKIYSDVTKKDYEGDTYEEALAKLEEDEKQQVALEQKKKTESEEALTKKKLCDAIEAADSVVKEAYQHRIDVEKMCQEKLHNTIEECKALVRDAKKAEVTAQQTKMKLVEDYQNRYNKGYTKVYTGQEAIDEYERLTKEFNDMWNSMFHVWF